MATDITDWTPEILPYVIGAPINAIELAIRNAAIEFCERTLLWTEYLDRISIEADTRSYDLTPGTDLNAEVVMTENVLYKQDGQDDDQFARLTPISEAQEDLDVYNPGSWQYWTAPVPTNYWVDIKDKQIHLFMIPEEASSEGLLVNVSLKPDATTTTLPDFLYRDWRTVIADGALSDLFFRKGTPWYDRDAGIQYKVKFNNGMSNAMNIKISGATKRPMRVRMRNFV